MLEFIILGEVPGTQFIVSLSWVLAVATVLFGGTILRQIHKKHDQSQLSTTEDDQR